MSSTSTDHLSVVSSNPSTIGTTMTSPITTMTSAELEPEQIHPSLEKLQLIARERATAIHTEQKAKKALRLEQQKQKQKELNIKVEPAIVKKPKKQLTKRQLSSKRSAEICRIKSGIYTELLERAVAEEEQQQGILNEQITNQVNENINLMNRINQISSMNQTHQQHILNNNIVDENDHYQPGLSNDFNFDENDQSLIDMSLVLPMSLSSSITTSTTDLKAKKLDNFNNTSHSSFINEVLLTHPVEQLSSPMTEISYDPNFFPSQKLSDSLLPIR